MKHPGSCLRWTLVAVSLGLSGLVSGCAAETSDTPAAPASQPQPEPPPVPVMGQVRSYQLSAVPSDFPVMLGCSDEELSHPDPYVYAQSVKICEAAQLGLYDLSQDTSLTADDQHQLGWALMGAALDRLAALRESVSGGSGMDGGTP